MAVWFIFRITNFFAILVKTADAVETFTIRATLCIEQDRTPCSRRRGVIDSERREIELTVANAMCQFDSTVWPARSTAR